MANQSVSSSLVGRLKLRTSYLSSTEVMGLLSVSRNTLYVWVIAGEIPAFRIGRDNRFDPLELAHWLEEKQLGQRGHPSSRVVPFTFMAKQAVSDSLISQLRARKGYLKTTQVMALLGLSRKTLCGWVRAGEIPALRIGIDNKFNPLELVHWLEERQLGRRATVSRKATPAA